MVKRPVSPLKTVRLLFLLAVGFGLAACEKKKSDSSSKTVVVPHSEARDQGQIGNCWAFATLGWVQSFARAMALRSGTKTSGQPLSEAYLTYRNIEAVLADPSAGADAIEGQQIKKAIDLVLKHGVMYAKDFRPDTSPAAPESSQVCDGFFQLKQSLQLGTFGDRSPTNIRKQLDKAFGVRMDSLEKSAVPAENIVFGYDGNNRPLTLASYLRNLREFDVPGDAAQMRSLLESLRVSENGPSTFPVSSPNPSLHFSDETRRLMRSVRWSLTEGIPVVFGTYVDFNAYDDSKGIFTFLNMFAANGMLKPAGPTGYHALVAVDYTATGVSKSANGSEVPFETKEGEETELNRRRALAFGDNMTSLITVNSWGDVGYTFEGRKGYMKLTGDYLFAWYKLRNQPERFLRKIYLLGNFAPDKEPPPFVEP